MKKRVGFLGPDGTFSQIALREYFGLNAVDEKAYSYIAGLPPTFLSGGPLKQRTSLFDGLLKKEVDEIIVPWENSTAGPVTDAVDALLHSQDLQIVGEFVLPIHLCLMVKPGVQKADITDVLSHPQPLMQCQKYLSTHFSQAIQHGWASTAEAARILNEGIVSLGSSSQSVIGIIGDPALASLYNLDIVETNIQDVDSNSTRFFIVGGQSPSATGHDKTTVVFSTKQDQPGSLYTALGVFATRNVNLTSIASRPAKTHLGEYLFWVDIEGHASDPLIHEAIDALRQVTAYVKVLGAYPIWDNAAHKETPTC